MIVCHSLYPITLCTFEANLLKVRIAIPISVHAQIHHGRNIESQLVPIPAISAAEMEHLVYIEM